MSIITAFVIKPDTTIIPKEDIYTVTAVFDAYEGDLFFFTDTATGNAMNFLSGEDDLAIIFELQNNDYVGDVFEVTLDANSKTPIIKGLIKLDI